MHATPHAHRASNRGTILIVVMLAVFLIAATAAALLGMTIGGSRTTQYEQREYRAFQAAEGALDRAMADLWAGGSGVFGAADGLVSMGGNGEAAFFTEVTLVDAFVRRIVATAQFEGVAQRVDARVRLGAPAAIPPAFENAIFSGNRSGDTKFRFALGGTARLYAGESDAAFAKRMARYGTQVAAWQKTIDNWPALAKAENARRAAKYQKQLAAWQQRMKSWDATAAMASAQQRYQGKLAQYQKRHAAWKQRMQTWTPPPGERTTRPPSPPRAPRKPTKVYPPRKPRPPSQARPPRKPQPPTQKGSRSVKRGDTVKGDIYTHGDVSLGAGATLDGDINTTGTAFGVPDQGRVNNLNKPWPLPDLKGMNHAKVAQVDVAKEFKTAPTMTRPNTGPESLSTSEMATSVTTVKDPTSRASIFAKGVLTDHGKVKSTTNDNFFLGDWHSSKDGQAITITPAQNNKIYYIDGNMWVETNGLGPKISTTDGSPVSVTFVVKGNLYFADQFRTTNPKKDGVMFIAMADGESFTDLNGNSQYDAGEPILDDDGDGVYEGNAEGSGNVFWGDPNAGPLGTVDGFIYAENNFDDYALDNNGTPQPFTINGFMQAGNQVRINRSVAGGSYSGMTVNYDARIRDGSLTLPGMPETGDDGPVVDPRPKVLAWELVRIPLGG